jgi:hypothetical protein
VSDSIFSPSVCCSRERNGAISVIIHQTFSR